MRCVVLGGSLRGGFLSIRKGLCRLYVGHDHSQQIGRDHLINLVAHALQRMELRATNGARGGCAAAGVNNTVFVPMDHQRGGVNFVELR